jgi:hypothetical protein
LLAKGKELADGMILRELMSGDEAVKVFLILNVKEIVE